jgi:hypothetical protein
MAVTLFREVLRRSRCIDFVFPKCSHAIMGHFEEDLPFRVEQWDATGGRLEQVLSTSADLNLARAAFAEAVRRRPAQRMVLRHKTRVIEEHSTVKGLH